VSPVWSPPTPAATPAPWRSLQRLLAHNRGADVLLLLALCGFLFFYGLGAGQLRGTESLRAIVAAEFLRGGNWLVPVLYGEPLFTKPPGMYAAIALASWPFGGVTTWTARLPSAVAATAAVLLVYWHFGRQLGRQGGLVAALVLPLSPLWLEKAGSAEIDMLQLAWVTAAILFFLRALEAEEDKETRRQGDKENGRLSSPCLHVSLSPCLPAQLWWTASLLCVAGGVLTKWTAPAFFYLTAVPLLWRRGRLRLLWGRRHLAGAALAAGLCLAWAGAAVALEGWEVFYRTVSNEALQRLSPGHSPRPYPWLASLLHPLKLLALALPWSAVALVTLRPGFARLWDERGQRLLQALHCWAWPSLLFWSLPTEHTPRHSFPLLPGISGLAALVVLAWLTGRLPWPLPRLGPRRALAGFLVCWLAVKVVVVEVIVPGRQPWGGPRAAARVLAELVPGGSILYIIRLKDEGVMFYFGRDVRRVASAADLPRGGGPVYCVLTAEEWRRWDGRRQADVLRPMYDGQGDPILLVRLPG
jgi:4-amino-4-deoxy-L-arabinose transferase-like glycosyltransferase